IAMSSVRWHSDPVTGLAPTLGLRGQRSLVRTLPARTIPPPGTERLEQRDRVRQPERLGLHASEQRLPIRLLSAEHRQIVDGSELLGRQSQIQADLRGLLGRDGRLECLSIRLERIQGISNVLERGDDSTSILGRGLLERRLRRALAIQQGSTVEERLREVPCQSPEGV